MLPSEHDFNGDMVGVPIEALVGPREPIIGADSRFLACARHVFEKKNLAACRKCDIVRSFARHNKQYKKLNFRDDPLELLKPESESPQKDRPTKRSITQIIWRSMDPSAAVLGKETYMADIDDMDLESTQPVQFSA